MEIPIQLQNPEFRFLLLQKGQKIPTADMKNWQNDNFQFDNFKFIQRLRLGYNYAIIGGYGNLVLGDGDTKEISDIFETKFPETFTVKTGSHEEYKKHYYFISDKPIKPIRLSKEKIGDLGDIRSVGQYVVAPNSVHPSGNEYKVIKDIPIAHITEEQIRETFKEFIDPKDNTEFKEFPIITAKRSSDYIRECRVPDYCINNKLKGETSKNWKLFPYIVDILWNREVSQSVYETIIKRQGHEVGAIGGWIKLVREGRLAKSSCEKMRDYLNRFHPELVGSICGDCKLYVKKNPAKIFTNRKFQAEEFEKLQPLFYDRAGNWWLWDNEEKYWKLSDEIDILNMVDDNTGMNTINSKEKNEILNSLKQIGRKNIPKKTKRTWIQFKNRIFDIETFEEFEATHEYFITNPIPWNRIDNQDTPIIDKLFTEWVGEDYKQTLYEIIAYCLLPDYNIHRIFCFVGEGLNGKTSFLKLLKKFLGVNNITSTELDTLL